MVYIQSLPKGTPLVKMALATHVGNTLAREPVPVIPHGVVMPCMAMGYYTEDQLEVQGFDISTGEFLLSDHTARAYGKVSFNSFLVPPKTPPPPPTCKAGSYAYCTVLGDCRVTHVFDHAAIVRTATSSAVVLGTTLQALDVTGYNSLDGVMVLVPDDTAFLVKGVETLGGTMGCLDHVLARLEEKGYVSTTGDVSYWQPPQASSVNDSRLSIVHLTGALACTNAVERPAPDVVCTSHAAAKAHFAVACYLQQNPWALDASLDTVLLRAGHDPALADGRLLCVPYKMSGNVVHLTTPMPLPPALAPDVYSFPASVLVDAVRNGKVQCRCNGKFTMQNTFGTFNEVVCPVDLQNVMHRLDALADQCVVIGDFDVKSVLPECPDVLLQERFGRNFDVRTGIFHSRA